MKFSKQIKKALPEIVFISLILIFFYIYYVVYLTESRYNWYNEMVKQSTIFWQYFLNIWR